MIVHLGTESRRAKNRRCGTSNLRCHTSPEPTSSARSSFPSHKKRLQSHQTIGSTHPHSLIRETTSRTPNKRRKDTKRYKKAHLPSPVEKSRQEDAGSPSESGFVKSSLASATNRRKFQSRPGDTDLRTGDEKAEPWPVRTPSRFRDFRIRG